MPLQTRIVEPVRISRFTVNESSGKTSSPVDHLESVTNGTCANIIYQLSSLSKHAENLFGELIHESHSLVARVGALKIRSNRLSTSIRLLDIIDEEGRCS
jgi:WAS family protein